MLVKNWMTRDVVVIDVEESMQHAIYKMQDHKINLLPVMSEDKLVGIVSDRDLKKASPSDATTLDMHEMLYLVSRIKIKDLMTKEVTTVPPEFTIEEAAQLLLDHRISGLPVTDIQGRVVSIITQSDIFRALISITGLGKKRDAGGPSHTGQARPHQGGPGNDTRSQRPHRKHSQRDGKRSGGIYQRLFQNLRPRPRNRPRPPRRHQEGGRPPVRGGPQKQSENRIRVRVEKVTPRVPVSPRPPVPSFPRSGVGTHIGTLQRPHSAISSRIRNRFVVDSPSRFVLDECRNRRARSPHLFENRNEFEGSHEGSCARKVPNHNCSLLWEAIMTKCKRPSVRLSALILFVVLLGFACPAFAHFGMVIPSDSMVMQDDAKTINLTLSFSHPFEMVGMELVKPKVFDVVANGQKSDLSGSLAKVDVMGHTAWKAEYPVKRPGVYVFAMEPQPYWEPVEDCFIIHYTKTVVTAFEDDEGWDAEAGLKTEIVPLSKPFGLYAGNVFQGIVKLDGKPVPYAEVEVE